MNSLMLMGMGTPELLVILGLFVLLFGAAKIPQLARSMGKSVHEFKKGIAEGGTGDSPDEPRKEEKPPDAKTPDAAGQK